MCLNFLNTLQLHVRLKIELNVEPLLNTSPNFAWKSENDVTIVGIPAGPLRVGPMSAAPISATQQPVKMTGLFHS